MLIGNRKLIALDHTAEQRLDRGSRTGSRSCLQKTEDTTPIIDANAGVNLL